MMKILYIIVFLGLICCTRSSYKNTDKRSITFLLGDNQMQLDTISCIWGDKKENKSVGFILKQPLKDKHYYDFINECFLQSDSLQMDSKQRLRYKDIMTEIQTYNSYNNDLDNYKLKDIELYTKWLNEKLDGKFHAFIPTERCFSMKNRFYNPLVSEDFLISKDSLRNQKIYIVFMKLAKSSSTDFR